MFTPTHTRAGSHTRSSEISNSQAAKGISNSSDGLLKELHIYEKGLLKELHAVCSNRVVTILIVTTDNTKAAGQDGAAVAGYCLHRTQHRQQSGANSSWEYSPIVWSTLDPLLWAPAHVSHSAQEPAHSAFCESAPIMDLAAQNLGVSVVPLSCRS